MQIRACMAAVAALLLYSLSAPAQETTATIVGNVTDSSGAPIAGANIIVTSQDRNLVVRTIKTGGEGEYVATLLPLGTYAIKAEARGFKSEITHDIVLHVSDKVTVPFRLELGSVNEVITVEASAVTVELQSAQSGNVITGAEIRDLGLNNRNYMQLISLMPGVVSNAPTDELFIGTTNPLGSTNTIPFSINGGRTSGNNLMIDGSDNVDRGSNLTLLNYPSVESIGEFKVLRGQYSAEYGRGATGQVNVLTRSGSSKFHGTAYEFFRNEKLSANSFFNNTRGIKNPPLRYNNFGYTFAGPIPIGSRSRTTNRTFFFWSHEFRRIITYSTFLATVPTDAMKQGIFSQPVCVQRSGSTCLETDTRITNISPLAKAYLQDIFSKIPSGDPGTYSLITPQRNLYNTRQELVKIDHQFNQRHTAFVRFINDTIPTQEPGGLFTGSTIPGLATTNTNSPGRNWTVRLTSTFRPNLLNEVGYSFSYGAIISRPIGMINSANSPDIKANLPFPSTLPRVPSLSFQNGSSITGYGPYDDFNRNYNILDNLTWMKGRQTIKTGVSINMYQKTENASGNNTGTFNFTPPVRPTGTSAYVQAFANFLLGDVATFTQASQDLTPDMRQRQWEAYVQDDVRVTKSFTVNAGVRFSQYFAPWDANKLLTNFDPAKYDPAKAPKIDPTNGNIIPGTGDPMNGIIVNNQNSPYGSKVSNESHGYWAPRVGFAWDPFGRQRTAIRSGYGISYDSTLVGIYEQNIFNNPPYVNNVTISNTLLDNPSAGVPTISAAPKSVRGTPLPYKSPYTQQWSFDIQQQLGRATMFTIGYYGSKSTHLLGVVDLNLLAPGAAMAAGFQKPGVAITSANTPALNAIRPYLGYNAINVIENWFNSNYNSLQTQLRKQFGSRGTFNISYTWSKALTDSSSDRSNAPQNFYNRRLEYARATFDRTHVLTASYNYTIPVSSGMRGVARGILAGWQISGIATFNSGLPLGVTTTGTDPGGIGFLGPSASGGRPDLVGDPNNNAPHTLQQWFNTSAFAAVPAGETRPGNASPRTVVGPGNQRWDTSLMKNFRLLSEDRLKLQMRFETFNTFNHTNWLGVSTVLGSTTFGQVTSAREPRRVQLAAKLIF